MKKVNWSQPTRVSQASRVSQPTPVQESQLLDGLDDDLLASALDIIDTAPRRRKRVSEMTTIDARELRREFDIPSNNTGADAEQFDDENLDSAILKAINFNGF